MISFLLFVPILLFSVVAHEYAHAWTAYRQGDPTAYTLGRLTLNPLPHIDPMMSVIVPVGLWIVSGHTFTFGAAKPVPVDPRNYRNYRKGDLIVSSAGIVTNLILGLLCAGVFVVLGIAGSIFIDAEGVLSILQRMVLYGIYLNYILAFFNLIPVPPLDGSHIFYHLLPPAQGARYRQLGRFGFVLILAVFLIPSVAGVLLWPATTAARVTLGVIEGYALPGLTQ